MNPHPVVTLVWNYFPFTFVFWTPVREILNILFFIPRILTYWTELIWNGFFESLPYLVFNILCLIILSQQNFKPLLLWTWVADLLFFTISTNVFYWYMNLTVFVLW